MRNRAAVVSGLAALIAEEVADTSLGLTREHLERLRVSVAAMGDLLAGQRSDRPAPLAVRRSIPPDADPAGAGVRARTLLVVEDDDDHYYLLESLLSRAGRAGPWWVMRARTLDEACTVLATGSPVCSLVDLGLPDSSELATLIRLRSAAPTQPIVVVTGADGEHGIEAVRLGAQDYLVKGALTKDLLDRAIDYAIERARFEAQLVHQALHDGMTGLGNRTLLLDRLSQALSRLHRHPAHVGVMFIDLDRFKIINDSLGHPVGDELLIEVARRLRGCVRASDTVARVGGDEFVVLLEDLPGDSEAARTADHLLEALRQPFDSSVGPHTLTASIGIALADSPDMSADTLMANADTAMYRAKEKGRARWELFDEEMRTRLVARFRTERELDSAMTRTELEVFYQPVVDAASARIVGVEALLRWNHPDRGLLLPASFLSVAEETGRISEIGEWVLGVASSQTTLWAEAGLLPPGFVTWVNVSSRQLDHAGRLTDDLAAALPAGTDGWSLGLEITESALIADVEGAARLLNGLRDLGARISIDDFGTGFSSLSWLQRLPIDQLKIDASFVTGLAHRPADEAIVAACLGLGRALGVHCTAEGVERFDILRRLVEMGCRTVQGFLFARPQPAGAVAELLRRGTVLPGEDGSAGAAGRHPDTVVAP